MSMSEQIKDGNVAAFPCEQHETRPRGEAMSEPKVNVLAVMDALANYASTHGAPDRHAPMLRKARAAMAELIERERVATQVFDCILRGVNDLSGPMGYRSEQFVASWLESWAKSLNAAGFKPSKPEATDIARALARIGGAA